MESTLFLSQVFSNIKDSGTYEYGYITLSSTEKTRTTWKDKFPYLTQGSLSDAEPNSIFRTCVEVESMIGTDHAQKTGMRNLMCEENQVDLHAKLSLKLFALN
jgi:hypothetical protein